MGLNINWMFILILLAALFTYIFVSTMEQEKTDTINQQTIEKEVMPMETS